MYFKFAEISTLSSNIVREKGNAMAEKLLAGPTNTVLYNC